MNGIIGLEMSDDISANHRECRENEYMCYVAGNYYSFRYMKMITFKLLSCSLSVQIFETKVA